MGEIHFAYIWQAPCGHINAACVDDPEHPSRSRRFVSESLLGGGHIERVTVEEARKRLELCKCERKIGE